ncbi:MAG TPA: hypothetical protein DDX40_03215 [Rikenellaceae bacterium]|nr:hypothetical protein [Rikenellaceae bacterium]
MKKILVILLAAAATLASCVKFEDDGQVNYDSTTAPDVTAQVVADDSIHVTITGKTGTGFYSYAVLAGAEQTLDAEKLLKDSYTALESGVIDFSKESSVEFGINGLTPNTTYTVYAVAASTMGVLTEIKTASATTTDSTAPGLSNLSVSSTDTTLVYTISYNDPVTLGKGEVTAHVYAVNGKYDKENKVLVEYKNYKVPAACLSTNGKNLIVNLPREEAIPGAIVTLTYTSGVVVNGVGTPCAAYSNSIVDGTGKVTKGIGGAYDNVSFDFTLDETWPADTIVYFSDWTKLVPKAYSKSDYALAGATKDANFKVKVVDGNGRTVSYDANTFKVLDATTVGFILNEAPDYGASLSFTIAEGSFEDLFGNSNNEFTADGNYYCSYGYSLNDIIGKYTVTGTSYWEDADETKVWVIEKSNDTKKGDVMITTYWGLPCDYPIYAYFDKDAGIFTIPDFQKYYTVKDAEGNAAKDVYLACNTNDDNAVVNMKVLAPGSFSGNDLWFGYYLNDLVDKSKSGWGNLFKTVSGTRTE